MFDPEYWMKKSSYANDEKTQRFLSREMKKLYGDKVDDAWVERVEINSHHLDDNFLTDVFGEWAGESILVVGAGLSATENIDGIKEARANGWRIIAVDRVHQLLKENEINPDITLSLDGSHAVKDFFFKLDDKDTVAVSIAQNPNVIDEVFEKAGHVFLYCTVSPFFASVKHIFNIYPKRLFALKPGAVVGYSAADLAYWMQDGHRETIAFIGNELSWKDKNVCDVYKGTGIQLIKMKSEIKTRYSIPAFIVASYAFDALPRLYPDADFVDCSDGIISNMRTETLDNVLKEARNG